MKKPDITQGEWSRWNDSAVVVGGDDNATTICVCDVDYYVSDSESEAEANAQAISAVPEMIDALIEAHESLTDRIENKGLEPSEDYAVKKIEQALLKAGVEL